MTSADDAQWPSSWASATNIIAFLQYFPSGSKGIWVLPMAGERPSTGSGRPEPAEGRKPQLFLESRFEVFHPAFSPDGRFIAYASHESGVPEVYVQPYPGPGEKTRISTAAGFDPLWMANGREILFRSGTREKHYFLSAAISSLSPFRAEPPRLLFEANAAEYDSTAPDHSWDVSPDGQRFLLSKVVAHADAPVTAMHVVLNWTDELKRLAPAK